MLDYPDMCIESTSYGEDASDGTSLERAEDGSPKVVQLYPLTQFTFTVVHKALAIEQQRLLQEFYEGAKRFWVRLKHPRYGNHWRVMMVGPPQVIGMPAPWLADVQMTLTGRPE